MADLSDPLLLIATFFVSFGASIISGMAGGGSGFIISPFLMLMGIPVSVAAATAKMNEVGVNTSSILTMRAVRRRTMVTDTGYTVEVTNAGARYPYMLPVLMAITLFNIVLAAWLIPRLQADGVKYIIAGLLLIMIPTLFIDKKAFAAGMRSKKWRRWGYVMYSFVSGMQAVFGMGIGMFVSMVLMYMFGLPVAEANDLKRRMLMMQASILLILLLLQHAVLLDVGVMALLGALVGGRIGTLIGVRKGSMFIKKMMAVIMLGSAVSLLIQA